MFNNKNRVKFLLILAISVTLIMGLGSTYAFFVYRENGSNVSIEAGDIKVTFVNNNNYLTTANSYPVSDDTGKLLPYYSDFSINASTQDMGIKYEIQVVPDTTNSIDPSYIKVYLTDQSDNSITDVLTYSDLSKAEYNENATLVHTSYITKTGTKDFRLRVWIDKSYALEEGQAFGFKIYLYAVNEKVTLLADKIEETLTLTDASTDIDGTRYVTGELIDNYVWYSGKLWRIVSINGDGSIKMVTDGNITALEWNTDNADYSTSQIRTWLNNEFLPTLTNADTLLVDSIWDYTTYVEATSTKTTPTAMVTNEKVGLLTIYDFYKAGGIYCFLDNGYLWWTMSPYDETEFWSTDGGEMSKNSSFALGVRPSINLKSDTLITGGDGTVSKPYIIEGDKATGTSGQLLTNRISGEYISFNDVLYRIIGIEEVNGKKLTKIIAFDRDYFRKNSIGCISFGANNDQRIFNPTYGIGLYLEEWYQADNTSETYATTYINDKYKRMIATATEDKVVWYTGPASGTGGDYTLSKTGTPVSATIGLGYYGEMFNAGAGLNGFLMTIYTSDAVWVAGGGGQLSPLYPTVKDDIIPSFYLKSDVKITGGSGMPHDPYTLSQ